MEINYTGQLRDARKLMFTHFGKTIADVAVMSDSEVIKCLDKEFQALEAQGDDNTIILIQHDKMKELLENGMIKVLTR